MEVGIDILKIREEYRELERHHKKLERNLSKLTKRRTLTAEEALAKKEMQKEKLLIKDKMAAILRLSGSQDS